MKDILEAALVLSAVDKASRVIRQVSDTATKALSDIQKKADNISKSAFSFGKNSMAVGLAMAAPLALATNEAIKFEDKMADVAKVMNLEVGGSAFVEVGKQVQDLSVHLAVVPEQAAALYANLAQGGVAKSELNEVARLAGEIGVAFGISSDMAGDNFIKMQNALGITTKEAALVADAMNLLGNETASASAELFEFMRAGGAGVAKQLKMGGQEIAAFGSTLISMGKSSAEAGTIMERFMKGILSDDQLRNIFNAKGGGLEGLREIVAIGSRLKGDDQFQFFQKFGQYGTDISLLSKNMGLLESTLGKVADESLYAGSSLAEFQNRQNTTATQIARLKTEVVNLAIDMGNILLPVLKDVLEDIKPIIDNIKNWIKENPELTGKILKFTAAIAGIAIIAGGVAFGIGGIAKAVSTFAQALKFLSANPIIAVIAIVASLVLFWEEFNAFFDKQPAWMKGVLVAIGGPFFVLAGTIKAIIKGFKGDWKGAWEDIKNVVMKFSIVGVILRKLGEAWDAFKEFAARMINSAKAMAVGIVLGVKMGLSNMLENAQLKLQELWQAVKDFGARMFEAGKNLAHSIADGIKEGAVEMVNSIKNAVSQVRDYLPFSPAKVGPLKDIHRIQLVETIAQSIKPAPMVNAMRTTALATAAVMPSMVGAMAMDRPSDMALTPSQSSSATVNYSPVITFNGPVTEADKESFSAMLKAHKGEIARIIEEQNARKQRTSF